MYWKNSQWRDAELVTVTTLADSGPGSLREALKTKGKRIIVFAVGGVIAVESELDIDDPWCWVCGYTAGLNGVILVGDGSVDSILNVNTSDVILQGLTILCNNSGEGTRSLSVAERGKSPQRIHLQNLATGVSEDENVIIWYDTLNVTYRDSISAFSLLPDGKGPNLGSVDGGNYWVMNNIFYGHRQRLPRTKADGGPIYLVNNLSMNHRGSGASVRNSDGCELHAYGNIDWQEEGSADYYISTDSDSPVYHGGNWLLRGKDGVGIHNVAVKDGRGVPDTADFGYIEYCDALMAQLIRDAGNRIYLDSNYDVRVRRDTFSLHVAMLVQEGEFAELSDDYSEVMRAWAHAPSVAINTHWDVARLIDAVFPIMSGGSPPDPEPDPGDPPPDEEEPTEPDLSGIVARLDGIDSKLDDVVDFVRAIRGALS
jgi:hypothetical protein